MSASPTVTDQLTLAVFKPRASAAAHSVGTRMSSAYQYQPSRLAWRGSNGVFARMPCSAGLTPVTSVVWLGNVTVGYDPDYAARVRAVAHEAAQRRNRKTVTLRVDHVVGMQAVDRDEQSGSARATPEASTRLTKNSRSRISQRRRRS